MICPVCGKRMQVTESRSLDDVRIRAHYCNKCHKTFYSKEDLFIDQGIGKNAFNQAMKEYQRKRREKKENARSNSKEG